MRQFAFVVFVLAALVACGRNPSTTTPAPAAERVQPFDLHIEIGRYGAMMGQVGDLTQQRVDSARHDDPTTPRELARALREGVWELNLTKSHLCAAGVEPHVSCTPPFNPIWIADPADADVAMTELKTRADALGAEVTPLWNAVCDDARTAVTDEDQKRTICAIE